MKNNFRIIIALVCCLPFSIMAKTSNCSSQFESILKKVQVFKNNEIEKLATTETFLKELTEEIAKSYSYYGYVLCQGPDDDDTVSYKECIKKEFTFEMNSYLEVFPMQIKRLDHLKKIIEKSHRHHPDTCPDKTEIDFLKSQVALSAPLLYEDGHTRLRLERFLNYHSANFQTSLKYADIALQDLEGDTSCDYDHDDNCTPSRLPNYSNLNRYKIDFQAESLNPADVIRAIMTQVEIIEDLSSSVEDMTPDPILFGDLMFKLESMKE